MQTISFNGVTYEIPDVGDESWGEDLTSYFVGIPQGALQKVGGNFSLTADVNFGAAFGIQSLYYKSRISNPSTVGIVRLAVGDTIGWRNNANTNNLLLSVNASDQLIFNGTSVLSNAITALTGDVAATGPGIVAATIANLAVTTGKIADSAITDLKVSASAAITLSKLAALTASRALVSDVSGIISVSSVTSTQIGFLSSTASAVLGQSDSGTFTNKTIAAGSNTISGLDAPNFTTQTAGTFLAGPISGSVTTPTFRALQSPTVQKFTSGTNIYITSAGVLYLRVLMVGAGGGGGGNDGVNGATTGGNTQFGSLLTANGGIHGNNGGSGLPGTGGGGTITGPAYGNVFTGASGGGANQSSSGTSVVGAPGGNSVLGGGAASAGGNSGNLNGQAGIANTGGGGGGGWANGGGWGGGGGGAGAFIDAFITSPSGSYIYVVGAGGSGSGTGGISSGGNGGSGYIEVIEYYQ